MADIPLPLGSCCWPSQAFWLLLEVHDQIFYYLLDMYVFRNGASSSTKEGSVFPCRRYVYFTLVSAQVYLRCHGAQVTVDSVHPLSLHCTKQHLCKVYRGFLSLKAMQQVMPQLIQPQLRVRITLWLAVYHQSVRLGVKPLETHDQHFFFFSWSLVVIVLM
jgi:hypothetical protein